MMENLINIRTLEDLNKILFIQKIITRRAKDELFAIIKDADMTNPLDDTKINEFMDKESSLLAKYAKYPTMTEYNLMPNLAAGTKWGATFGVTLLVQDLILEHVKIKGQESFYPVFRPMYMILLAELDNPTHNYLVEPLEKALHITLTQRSGEAVPGKDQAIFIRKMVSQFVEMMLHVSMMHNLVEFRQDSDSSAGYAITPLGKRILLHLMDAHKVVHLMSEAYQRLRDEGAISTEQPASNPS